MTGPDTFRFLGVEQRIERAADWNHSGWPKLWLYNAHYFDDLLAADAAIRGGWHRVLIARWLAENPPGHGNGWEPYPTSRRIVNWVQWALTGNELDEGTLHSLAVQARWLSRRLEHHLLGNHLWTNAKALVFAGAYFGGAEGERWLKRGIGLVGREIAEQVLPDGGHFERSPMYHSILLEDLLDLVQLARRYAVCIEGGTRADWANTAARMLEWACAMAHPDGEPAFFNDAAFGIAPSLPTLCDYAGRLGVSVPGNLDEGLRRLLPSGYVRMANGPAVLLADVAPVGPDYMPGHAHADTLSFELSVGDCRVLVNSGTSTYEKDTERQRQRGTAAHNTVVVDGEDSSEVWAAFRVARRARVHDISVAETGDRITLSASHDGYRRLPGRVTHRRQWELCRSGLMVTDMLEGRFERAEARFHFAPGTTLAWSVEGGEGRVEPSTWHPRFGVSVPNEVLVVRLAGPRCRVRFEWA